MHTISDFFNFFGGIIPSEISSQVMQITFGATRLSHQTDESCEFIFSGGITPKEQLTC
jgi:hypothetical protein